MRRIEPEMSDSTAAQHHFSTGWVMFHLPGDPPDSAELDRAIGIMQQHQVDWNFGTLGRGTMNNTLFADGNCNGVPDAGECIADFDGDNQVAITDFLFLLDNWGSPLADLDGDGDTGITDFLNLLASWGPCP